MISILYDPKQRGIELANLLFEDPIQRVAKYPVDKAPDFKEKDTSLRDLICGNVREMAINEDSYQEQINMLRSNLNLLEEDRKKDGLTLEEWMFLHNSKELWMRSQSDPLQRSVIETLKKLYRESAKKD